MFTILCIYNLRKWKEKDVTLIEDEKTEIIYNKYIMKSNLMFYKIFIKIFLILIITF